MSNCEIQMSVIRVIKDMLLIDSMDKNKLDKHFFSSEIGMKPRELICLIAELEKKFNIFLLDKDLLNKKIFCVSGLVEIISNKLISAGTE